MASKNADVIGIDGNRLWTIGCVLVMVVVVVLGWLLGIQPQLASAAAADEQRASVEATNTGHAALLARLKEDFTDLESLSKELASLGESVPTGTEMPAFVNQLDALAGDNEVTLAGITVAEAQPYTPVAAPVTPTASSTASDPASATAASATAVGSEASVAALAAGAPPVTNSRITADNFAAMSVQITISGEYGNVLDFVQGLQTGTRLFMATGLSTSASAEASLPEMDSSEADYSEDGFTEEMSAEAEGGVTAIISGLIYVLVTPESASAPTAADHD